MEKYHLLTKKEIIGKLKSMQVGEGMELPIKVMSFITPNAEYDPDSFSQEIEDSEDEVSLIKEVLTESRKPGFDWIWNNTIGDIKKNSPEWYANHNKKCELNLHMNAICLSSVHHKDGSIDYYSEDNLGRILQFAENNGGIVDFC